MYIYIYVYICICIYITSPRLTNIPISRNYNCNNNNNKILLHTIKRALVAKFTKICGINKGVPRGYPFFFPFTVFPLMNAGPKIRAAL